jgi:DNA polymerase
MTGVVFCDFETRSAVDLRKTGVYVYASDASTDVWCLAYSWDGEDIRVWKPGDPIDTELEDWIVEGGKMSAFNANFERVIWNKIMAPRYNWPRTRAGQWYCTMAQASAAGLPRSLGQAAAVLGVEEQKDKVGQALMLRMARPRKTLADGTHTWWTAPDKVNALIEYCRQDVRTEMDVSTHIPYLPDSERQLFLLDQRINDRGVMLDRDLLERVRRLATDSKAEIDAEINRLTKGEVRSATQGMHLAAWLRKYGVQTSSVDKQAVAKILSSDGLHPVIRRVVELRQSGAKSSTAKLDAMEHAAGEDDRMRGLLVYHGAATGRWSGKLVQPQNFPRPVRKQAELDEIIAKLKADQSIAEHGHGTEIAADLLRSMIIAAPDHRLMFADYSAIEARVLAWMAGQKDLVETFAKGGDVYIKMASAIYNVPEDKVTPEQRQVGKMAILGCGYGMGGKRFAEQCAVMGIDVDVEEAKRIVSIYRQENNQIAAYWQSLEAEYLELARDALDQGETILRYALPSGRHLTYRNPRIVQRETPWGTSQDTVEIDTLNSITRQWVPQKIWGGLAVENVVQATARDLMAGAMMRLESAGYPVIMSVHDEIICEVPVGYGSLDEMIEIMTSPPAWAKGCPIAAEGKEGPRYRK